MVLLLGNASSVHLRKIYEAIKRVDIEVVVYTRREHFSDEFYDCYTSTRSGLLGFFELVYIIRKFLKTNCAVVNAHYITSYGLIGALSSAPRLILSVWGSDILVFPRKSFLHRQLIRFVLRKADCIFSTSNLMVDHVRLYLKKDLDIIVTPFGVDVSLFKPRDFQTCKNKFVIGTVKSLESQYGIDRLIHSFGVFLKMTKESNNSNADIRLVIAGSGSQLPELLSLVRNLGISSKVVFLGEVSNVQIPFVLSGLDLFVSLSRSESFGVSALEASAVGLPVIVSNIRGFDDVVVDGETGYMIDGDNFTGVANLMNRLFLNKEERQTLGGLGRKRVVDLFALSITESIIVGNIIKQYRLIKCVEYLDKFQQKK